jgi:hypothetical protein
MDAPCDFEQAIETNWQHTIEKVSNINRKVFPYIDDTRKCIMKMDVTINGVEHYTSGDYVFGPDATENYACEQATIKAKKQIISKVSPEVLTSKTEMNCSVRKTEEPVLAQSDTLPTHTPAPQPEVKVIERVIVEKRPSVIVERRTQPTITFIPMTGNSGYIQTNPVDKVISSMVELLIGQNNY